MKNTLFIALLMFTAISVYAQKTLQPVDEGSKVHFVIKNLGINTGGDLQGLSGKIVLNVKNPAASSADVTVAVKTIDTDNDRRDGHLQNEDFFDAAKYPTIRIVSTKITPSGTPGTYIFTGNLTIKDVTKPLTFNFTVLPNGAAYLFAGDFDIKRSDFGLGKSGGTMSDDVSVSLKVIAK